MKLDAFSLQPSCRAVFLKSPSDMMMSDEWLGLSPELVEQVLRFEDDLAVSEEVVFDALLRWGK